MKTLCQVVLGVLFPSLLFLHAIGTCPAQAAEESPEFKPTWAGEKSKPPELENKEKKNEKPFAWRIQVIGTTPEGYPILETEANYTDGTSVRYQFDPVQMQHRKFIITIPGPRGKTKITYDVQQKTRTVGGGQPQPWVSLAPTQTPGTPGSPAGTYNYTGFAIDRLRSSNWLAGLGSLAGGTDSRMAVTIEPITPEEFVESPDTDRAAWPGSAGVLTLEELRNRWPGQVPPELVDGSINIASRWGESIQIPLSFFPDYGSPGTAQAVSPSIPVTSIFNGIPGFNLQIENATQPACGCKGESTYNQGISIAVEDPCPKCKKTGAFVGILQDAGPATVFLHSGEFFLHTVDLEIPGRGFNWKFERKYRSGITFDGPLGHNWEFNYNRRLSVETNGNVTRMDGSGRADRYELAAGRYTPPPGFYTRLVRDADGTFTERDRSGTQVSYRSPDSQGIARMTELRDRHGNRMRFEHNAEGQLVRVIDTFGRPVVYRYNSEKRLVEVEDFIGRRVRLEYDRNGDLVAMTSPAVTGTPNGNDFPAGKTTRYRYSSGFSDERRNHNLLEITAPNEAASGGPPRVKIEYETNPASPNVDRVLKQTIGGVNATGVPAGGTISYEYRTAGTAAPNDFSTPVFQNTVTDRNGNLTEYQFNQLGNIVRGRKFTNRKIRPGDPDFFETRYEYTRDGEMTRMILPEGNSVEYVYDDQNPDRFRQGNLLAEIRRPDAKRGGDQEFIKVSYAYEPIYSQLRSVTEARGNDPKYVPQNGGANSPERYTTAYMFDYQEGENYASLARQLGVSEAEVRELLKKANILMGLGDVNGDGRTDQITGNVVKVIRPTVNLLLGSNMARIQGGTQQSIVEVLSHNQYGQLTKQVDPEGNVDVYDYYPENDPDGDGGDLTPGVGTGPLGYLKQVTQDAISASGRNSGTNPPPTRIRRLYRYDRVGNVIREVDGRGIATDHVVNQLNQVVQIVRAAAHNIFAPDPPEPLPLTDFKYLERIFYDFNNNVVRRQVEDRGNTSSVGGDNIGTGTAFVDYEYQHDILDKRIEMRAEVSDSEHLITRYRYDRNDNRALVIQPEGNASASIYDERDLLYQRIRGAASAPAPALLAAGDPTNYNVRGGVPSTMSYHYDRNRNPVEIVDAADTDGSPANNSKLGGAGDRTRTVYDGFDRRTSIIDSVGNQTVIQYDPASNLVRVGSFGPVGGPSPTSDGPDALLMPVSSGGVIQPANLVARSLLGATERRYDELSRVFEVARLLFVNTVPTVRPSNVADGAADLGKGTLMPRDDEAIPGLAGIAIVGRVRSRTEYDRRSRRTFGVQDDGDTSRVFYDGAGRVIKAVDAEGNTVEWAYDANANVIEKQRTDVAQVPGVPNEVFLTTNFYDSLDRLQRTVDNVGQTFDYRYDSRDNLVATADAEGPVGPAIGRRAFPGGARARNVTNGFGNVTRYAHDGVNRRILQDVILTASGHGDGVNIGADIFGIPTATPARDASQGGGDGVITTRYSWDRDSLLAALTDDNGNQTRYTYDNLNRRLAETKGTCVPPALADRCDPPTSITYEYDADDNLVWVTDENGSVTRCRFDALNRPTSCRVARAAGVVGTTAASFEYDGLSRLTRATDNNEPAVATDDSIITFAYDSLSRVIEETQQIGSLPARAVSSAWRAENLRSGLTYPSGRVLEFAYDKLDRLKAVSDRGAGPALADYDYIGPARVLQRRYALNGTRMTYLDDAGKADVGYDGLGRPVQLRHLRADNSLIVGFRHSYDRMSNKRSEDKLHAEHHSEVYRYDSAYRLVRFGRGTVSARKDAAATPDDEAPLHRQWTLDGVGNWRQVNDETRQHSSFNEITIRKRGAATSTLFDRNGNMTDDGTFVFEWDYQNRLRAVTRRADGARVAVYAYDALNRRIRKVVTSSGALDGTTHFYLDGWREIEERDAAGAVVQQYVYGNYIDEPLVLDRKPPGGGTPGKAEPRLFYHQNTLFSVSALTGRGGRLVEGLQYEAFGRQTVLVPGRNGLADARARAGVSSLDNPYLYTGRRLDGETGLYYYRARYFDPLMGRFLGRDPIGIWGDVQNLGNGYTYAANNPVNGVDPAGLDRYITQFCAAGNRLSTIHVGMAVDTWKCVNHRWRKTGTVTFDFSIDWEYTKKYFWDLGWFEFVKATLPTPWFGKGTVAETAGLNLESPITFKSNACEDRALLAELRRQKADPPGYHTAFYNCVFWSVDAVNIGMGTPCPDCCLTDEELSQWEPVQKKPEPEGFPVKGSGGMKGWHPKGAGGWIPE